MGASLLQINYTKSKINIYWFCKNAFKSPVNTLENYYLEWEFIIDPSRVFQTHQMVINWVMRGGKNQKELAKRSCMCVCVCVCVFLQTLTCEVRRTINTIAFIPSYLWGTKLPLWGTQNKKREQRGTPHICMWGCVCVCVCVCVCICVFVFSCIRVSMALYRWYDGSFELRLMNTLIFRFYLSRLTCRPTEYMCKYKS